jgi:hypothetical protein
VCCDSAGAGATVCLGDRPALQEGLYQAPEAATGEIESAIDLVMTSSAGAGFVGVYLGSLYRCGRVYRYKCSRMYAWGLSDVGRPCGPLYVIISNTRVNCSTGALLLLCSTLCYRVGILVGIVMVGRTPVDALLWGS